MKRLTVLTAIIFLGLFVTLISNQGAAADSANKRLKRAQAPLTQLTTSSNPKMPALRALSTPIEVGVKSRAELIEERRARIGAMAIAPTLVPVPKGTPGKQVLITTDFQARGSQGGAVIAVRDSNNDGIADQQTVMTDNAVDPGDAITKIVASQRFFGRYFAITENSELIQIDDVDEDYLADDVISFGDIRSLSGIGVGIATGILDDGTEAVYLMRTDAGNDQLFFTTDDTLSLFVYLDRNRDNELDAFARFFTSRQGFSSLGGFAVGVETSVLFQMAQFDNSGRVLTGAILSYYDFDGNGVPENFSTNNGGIFAEGTTRDRRPAIATDIVQSGTDFYVTAPLAALRLANNDDIVIYSDLNATQIADGDPILFAVLPGLDSFSTNLGGLAVALDGTRVAVTRNSIAQGQVQGSRVLLFKDDNLNFAADGPGAPLFDNGRNGIGGACFSNVDLLGPQPIIIDPRLKRTGKFVLGAIGSRFDTGAQLIVDGREQFSMRLNSSGTQWIISASALSRPGGFTIRQLLASGDHILIVRNTTGQESLPVFFGD